MSKQYFRKSGVYSFFLALLFTGSFAAQDMQVIHEKTFDTTPGKILKVEAQSASIKVETWSKNEVYVKVLGEEKVKAKFNFHFEQKDWGVYVSAKRKDSFWGIVWGRGYKMRIEVMVPASYNTRLSSSGGNIGVKDLYGSIDVKTSGGDIKLVNNTGNANMGTSGGDVIIKQHKGETRASTSGGDITASDVDGNLSVSTSGGDIDLKGGNGRIDASTSGGDVKLVYSGDNEGIDLSTSGGDIEVWLPSDFNAKANLRTSGGSISCDLTANNAVKISSSRFEADLNKGGKLLKCTTSGGDIDIKKK